MKISRQQLLSVLQIAARGLTGREVLEQSNSFVFLDGRVITFNDEVLVSVSCPLDFDAVVFAEDLPALLGKFPDDVVEVTREGNEVIVAGTRRSAGIPCSTEVKLPYTTVPDPKSWSRLQEGVLQHLQQAAQTCGRDATHYLTTVVHVTPDRIEACDNLRLFRVDGPTGFSQDCLIPASGLGALVGVEVSKVGMADGWIHFKTGPTLRISLRSTQENYHKGLDDLLKIEKGEKVILPNNLDAMLERAEVMFDADFDTRVLIEIHDGELRLTSHKETGWFKERKRVRYVGKPLAFEIHPRFLYEVLRKTHEVTVGSGRLRFQVGPMQFIVSLVMNTKQKESKE